VVTNPENHISHSDSSRVAQAERTGTIRAGWNDAAWGRPRRVMRDRLAPFYEPGYVGGLVFRRRYHAMAALKIAGHGPNDDDLLTSIGARRRLGPDSRYLPSEPPHRTRSSPLTTVTVQQWVLLVSGTVAGWYLMAIVAWLRADRAVAKQVAGVQRQPPKA
jgi:hypothetical protein